MSGGETETENVTSSSSSSEERVMVILLLPLLGRRRLEVAVDLEFDLIPQRRKALPRTLDLLVHRRPSALVLDRPRKGRIVSVSLKYICTDTIPSSSLVS